MIWNALDISISYICIGSFNESFFQRTWSSSTDFVRFPHYNYLVLFLLEHQALHALDIWSLQGSASSSPCGFHVLGLNILELLVVFNHEQVIHTYKSLINDLLSADGIWTIRYFLIFILLFWICKNYYWGLMWIQILFFCRSIFDLKSVHAESMWIGSSGFNPSPFSFATNF